MVLLRQPCCVLHDPPGAQPPGMPCPDNLADAGSPPLQSPWAQYSDCNARSPALGMPRTLSGVGLLKSHCLLDLNHSYLCMPCIIICSYLSVYFDKALKVLSILVNCQDQKRFHHLKMLSCASSRLAPVPLLRVCVNHTLSLKP